MKKRAFISIILAMTMIAGCAMNEMAEETTVEETTTEATAETTTETSVAATPTPIPRPRITVTPTPMPTPTPAPVPPGDVITEGTEQYDMFMAKIDEIEASSPGQYEYQFAIEMNSCILTVFDGTDKIMYVITDGVISDYNEDVKQYAYIPDTYLSYEEIKLIPFLCDTRFSFDTLGEDAVDFNAPVTEVVENIPDGMYFGGLIGLSVDGTSAFIIAGTPISFDRDEMLALDEGDPIGYLDFTVEKIHSNSDYDYVQIDLSSESFNIGCLHLTNNNDADDSRLYLCEESNDWMLENAVIVQVPVSPSVELGGNYEIMLYGQEGYDPGDREMTGNSLLDSSYWAYISDDENNYNYSSGTNNGWRDCCGGLEPVVIENGQITYMAIGYR